MAIFGGFLRLIMLIAYFIAFICALLITGTFAWFISVDSTTNNEATLALAAIVLLYTLIQTILICCTAGIKFLWIISIIGDVISMALMIAIAAMNESGKYGCGRRDFRNWGEDAFDTIRSAWDDAGIHACRLFVASFAVAIVAIFMFLVTIVLQVLVRRRQRRNVVVGVKSEGDQLPMHGTPA